MACGACCARPKACRQHKTLGADFPVVHGRCYPVGLRGILAPLAINPARLIVTVIVTVIVTFIVTVIFEVLRQSGSAIEGSKAK